MNGRSLGAALAALLFAQSSLNAQVPAALPGAPVAAVPAAPLPAGAGPVPVGGVAVPAAAPNNLFSFLCPTPAQVQACKQKLCASPLVQFLGNVLTPLRVASGGLLPQCCPGPNQPNPADLVKPADSAEGAAARIKQEEANAKARRAAVRYLGTVDCKRFPEAEAALINALRADTNECVRFEAALALSRSCCCTKKVLQALAVTVSGRATNDPPETSERVKAVAAVALERCLQCYTEKEPVKAPETGPPQPSRPEVGPPEAVPPSPPPPLAAPPVAAPPPVTAPPPPQPSKPKAEPPPGADSLPLRLPAPPAAAPPSPQPGKPTSEPPESGPLPLRLPPPPSARPPSPAQAETVLIVDPSQAEARRVHLLGQKQQLIRPVSAEQPASMREPERLSAEPAGGEVSPWVVAEKVAQATMRPAPAPQVPQAIPASDNLPKKAVLPPTGHRDLWTVLKTAFEGK